MLTPAVLTELRELLEQESPAEFDTAVYAAMRTAEELEKAASELREAVRTLQARAMGMEPKQQRREVARVTQALGTLRDAEKNTTLGRLAVARSHLWTDVIQALHRAV